MGSFEKKVLMYIRKYRLWQPGDAVTMAVSGGLDSMVLMHVLNRTQPAHGASLSVVTFDHGLRPESATEANDEVAKGKGKRLI